MNTDTFQALIRLLERVAMTTGPLASEAWALLPAVRLLSLSAGQIAGQREGQTNE